MYMWVVGVSLPPRIGAFNIFLVVEQKKFQKCSFNFDIFRRSATIDLFDVYIKLSACVEHLTLAFFFGLVIATCNLKNIYIYIYIYIYSSAELRRSHCCSSRGSMND